MPTINVIPSGQETNLHSHTKKHVKLYIFYIKSLGFYTGDGKIKDTEVNGSKKVKIRIKVKLPLCFN